MLSLCCSMPWNGVPAADEKRADLYRRNDLAGYRIAPDSDAVVDVGLNEGGCWPAL